MNDLDPLVNNQLPVNMRVYFWALYSMPLVFMSVLRLGPHSLDYCSFVMSFEIGKPHFAFDFCVSLNV